MSGNEIRHTFWITHHDDRTFAQCMAYFRVISADNSHQINEQMIDMYCPEHLHEILKAQFKLEGLL